MFPKIIIPVPWWVWILLVVMVAGLGLWVIGTDPDPHPSFKNHLRHLVTLWARNMQHATRGRTCTTNNPDTIPLQQRPTIPDTEDDATAPTAQRFCSRGEQICRTHLEQRFRVPFRTVRPAFLKNPVTGENLEIDLYNEDLRLGVEYNGIQHYRFNTHFHRGSNDRFQNQQYRDLIKKQLCDENGVRLITVPYWIDPDDIPAYLDRHLDDDRSDTSP